MFPINPLISIFLFYTNFILLISKINFYLDTLAFEIVFSEYLRNSIAKYNDIIS